MQKNIIISLLLILVLLQFGYTSKSSSNPALMHMRLKEFIAASIAQGLMASGVGPFGFSPVTPEKFAKTDLEYTDALMQALDRDE
jgi:hypothetical protein